MEQMMMQERAREMKDDLKWWARNSVIILVFFPPLLADGLRKMRNCIQDGLGLPVVYLDLIAV